MSADEKSPTGPTARIISFRRKHAAGEPHVKFSPRAETERDLAKFAGSDGPGEYRHRMMVNLAAFLFIVFLTCVAYWLADTIAQMRRDQDCVLSGRRNCTPINVIPRDRW